MADRNDRLGWEDDDNYWRTNFRSRPYASAGNEYDYYRPGYMFGYEQASRYEGRSWDDVESDMSRSWSSYEHRGTSTWEQMKDAVRDAWDRVTGRHTVGSR
jgi:hypothetical protein